MDLSGLSTEQLIAMADPSPAHFATAYGPQAANAGQQLGVDPHIILAQWGEETGWGKSIVPGTNNLGNIKDPSGKGPTAVDNSTGTTDSYNAYNTPDDFATDYAGMIQRKYPGAVGAGTDVGKFTAGLKGYAQDKNYGSKVSGALNTLLGAITPSANAATPASQPSAAGPDMSQMSVQQLMALAGPPAGGAPAPTQAPAAPAPQAPANPMQQVAGDLTNNWIDQLTQGMLHGVTNTVGGAVQKGAHAVGDAVDLVTRFFGGNQPTLTSQITGQQPTVGSRIASAGDTAANFLQQGTPTSIPGRVGQFVGGGALPLPAARGVLPAMATGATLSALQPVNDAVDEPDFWKATAMQGAGGAAAGAGGAMVGRALQGIATPAARAFAAQGGTLTPGQAAGGVLRSIEEKMKSIPGGEAIGSAERANQGSFNRMMYQDALAPMGQQLPAATATGSDAITAVHDAIGQGYDQMAANVTFRPQGIFRQDLAQIRNELSQAAPGRMDQFNNIIDNQIDQKMQPLQPGMAPTRLNGDQWNDTRSYMSTMARSLRMGNSSPDDRALAQALDDTVDAMNSQVARQAPPQFQSQLDALNNSWARYKRLEEAAGGKAAMARGNVFTPAEYLGAVRNASTKYQRANTTGLNAPQAVAAQDLLGNKYPDSGTAGRMLLDAGIMSPALLLHQPQLLAAPAALMALYGTRGGRALMQAGAMGIAPRIGSTIQGASPLLGILAGAGAGGS